MLENSYDALGIKFGIIISPFFNDCSKELESIEKQEEILRESMWKAHIVDFNDVDGLTLDEVLKISPKKQANNVIVFVIYNGIEYEVAQGTRKQVEIGDMHSYFIKKNKENCNQQIDDVISNWIIDELYQKADDNLKKYFNCFLQRYKYGTKKRTDEVLKEKIYNKEQY